MRLSTQENITRLNYLDDLIYSGGLDIFGEDYFLYEIGMAEYFVSVASMITSFVYNWHDSEVEE